MRENLKRDRGIDTYIHASDIVQYYKIYEMRK